MLMNNEGHHCYREKPSIRDDDDWCRARL